MKQKRITLYFLPIIFVIIVTAFMEGLANPKNEWLTYENQNFGYSFNYPPDCTYGPLPTDCKTTSPEEQSPACLCFLNPENPDRVLMQTFQRNDGKQLVMAEFFIGILDISKNKLPTDVVLTEDWLAENFPDQLENAEIENIKVDGVPAMSVTSPASGMAPAIKEIYFSHNDHIFQIRMLDPDREGNSGLYERILTSFHFDS